MLGILYKWIKKFKTINHLIQVDIFIIQWRVQIYLFKFKLYEKKGLGKFIILEFLPVLL
jgi:hypothetical protein